MNAIETSHDTAHIIESCNFCYRLICCHSYLPAGKAYIGGRYYDSSAMLVLTLGDTILLAHFDKTNTAIPDDFKYLGLEQTIRNASVNMGLEAEKCLDIDKTTFSEAINKMVKETAYKRLLAEQKIANQMWHEIGLSGEMPNNMFVEFMKNLYSEDVKPGEKKTPERYVHLYKEILTEYGYTEKGKSIN